MTDGSTGSAGGGGIWDRLDAVPSMDDDPVVWDPLTGKFVPRSELVAAPASPAAPPPDATQVLRSPPRPAPPRSAPPGSRPAGASSGGVAPPSARPPRQVGRGAGQPNQAPARSRRRRRRHPWLFRFGIALLPLVVFFVTIFGFMYIQFATIDRVDVSSVLVPSTGNGTTYLVVGTDSRAGIDPDDPNAGAFLGEEIDGQRTDTIMLLRTVGDRTLLMSIPRDLWVTNPASGEPGRINATFRSGPGNLITAVTQLGVPVDHYVEINFVSFGRLVDALGGIEVDIEYPARDTHSGLDLPTAGTVTLTGDQALAYVRSRYYEEQIDGQWVAEGTGDLGRVKRQQQFLSGLLTQVGSVRNPMVAKDVLGAFDVGLRIDDTITFVDALKLAWNFGRMDMETIELPTEPRTTSGGAEVLELKQPQADLALSQFGDAAQAPDEATTTTTAAGPGG